MNESEVLEAAIMQAKRGDNVFNSFQGYIFSTPEPYLALIRIVCDYVSPGTCPFVTGKDREEWLKKRLDKFHVKYLETI